MKQTRTGIRHRSDRRGVVTVVAAMFVIVFVAFAAMVVDCGYLVTSRAELQRATDAAALSACWEYAQRTFSHGDTQTTRCLALERAQQCSLSNQVCRQGPTLLSSDVQWGYLADVTNRTAPLNTCAPLNVTNAVSVVLRRTSATNGSIPSLFGKALGRSGYDVTATATAALIRNIRGFKAPTDGTNLGILPIALDNPSWVALMGGTGSDQYSYNPATGQVTAGSDGIRETNLYPKDTGMPGNRGTVDIGSSGNSTADLARQIVHGVSASDLAHLGGKLEFNEQGKLYLNGDTGISAGIKDELESIKGKPRVIPIFTNVQGPGNNAEYTIERFVGIRIMNVNLTGSKNSKCVIVQPAAMVIKGVIPSTSNNFQSDYIFSSAMLVR